MLTGLPLIVLIFFVMLAVVAFWRLILMVLAAAFLTVLTLGVIDVVTWAGALR